MATKCKLSSGPSRQHRRYSVFSIQYGGSSRQLYKYEARSLVDRYLHRFTHQIDSEMNAQSKAVQSLTVGARELHFPIDGHRRSLPHERL